MRKQNSTFKTAFLSEAGSELKNNDYFAFVELEQYACYVIADGLNDVSDTKSARMAIEAVLLAFQEHPSMKKRVVCSYIKAADRALCKAGDREKQKASVVVVVTDYAKLRYAYAGNTRLVLYRNGDVRQQTTDMSLGSEIGTEKELPEDILARHEERNNLYSYVGQGKGFAPAVSKKLKLENGDIITLYTRGIWENLDSGELKDVFAEAGDEPKECLDNIEDLLLSRQPEKLDNYTFAAIFVDKVFLDPARKKKIRRRIMILMIVLIIVLIGSLLVYFWQRIRHQRIEQMDRNCTEMVEYIQDFNFVRAEEECRAALELAEKLKNREKISELSDYLKLIEAVNAADEDYGGERYEDAQTGYSAAKERSRLADHVADTYIDQKLESITDYLSVFDYIQLGDRLAENGDYERAEEKYLEARTLATRAHFEEGRRDAMDALEALYEERKESEEAGKQEAEEQAAAEIGAAQLAAEGDKAFSEEDYVAAIAYYTMALEKYQELQDTMHAERIQTKLSSCEQKIAERDEIEKQEDEYVEKVDETAAPEEGIGVMKETEG